MERTLDIRVEQAHDVSELQEKLGGERFDFVAVHGNFVALSDKERVVAGAAHLHGATSCLGAMTHAGVTEGVAAFAIRDPDGAYGTALRAFEGDPEAASCRAVAEALAAAGRPGEQPDLVWVSATPGHEELVLTGIESIVGRDVPIIGGSAADNSVAGDWFVFGHELETDDGVVVSVLFPSRRISFAYQNGYSPTACSGVVTRASGRTIHEIDGAPALDVYSAWTDGAVSKPGPGEAEVAILSQSTFWPLGREVTQLGRSSLLPAGPSGGRPQRRIDRPFRDR
jgi:hypothetical protein